MKIAVIVSIGVLLLAGLTACAASEKENATNTYQEITAEDAKQKMEEGGVTIVDVRTAAEYAEAHIPDAINIPNEEIASEPPQQLPDKEATLLLYCRSGRRSKEAAKKLAELGYSNVYEFGGIMDWPYDTVS